MGFIEEIAKAKAYDNMKENQTIDAINAARAALVESKAKEYNTSKVLNSIIGKQVEQNMSDDALKQQAMRNVINRMAEVNQTQGGLANSFLPTQENNMNMPPVDVNRTQGLAGQAMMDTNATR